MRQSHVRGFTLVELLVTIAVLAILIALGLPSFQGSLRSNRLATTTNELLATLSLARTEAVRNTRGAAVCPSEDGTVCGGAWNQGWLVWSDLDSDGSLDANETTLRFTRVDDRLQVSGPGAGVLRFDARGRLEPSLGGAQQIGLKSEPCPATQELVRVINVNPTGQVNVEKEACS